MAIHRVASLPMARVVPHLLRESAHQIEADPHGVGSAHSSDAMEIRLHAIGQRHIHHERDFFHVDSARRHVRADQNPRLSLLERLHSIIPRQNRPAARDRVPARREAPPAPRWDIRSSYASADNRGRRATAGSAI